jgi:hypothetical protein
MKHKSNVEKVTEYMEFGSGMNQAFLMEAVDRYAKQIAANEAEVIKKMDKSFISGEAWVQSAKQWLKMEK